MRFSLRRASVTLIFLVTIGAAAYQWVRLRTAPPEKIEIQELPEVEYDYIIVGGGTSGSVLAARLSERSDLRILLVEAGGDDAEVPDVHVPMATWQLQGDPSVDWAYLTTRQDAACLSMPGGQCLLSKGRVLGGSSSIHCPLYSRGTRHDYDRWAVLGCRGWSYRDVLPYFLRAEGGQGTGGLRTSIPEPDSQTTPLGRHFVRAGAELGYSQRGNSRREDALEAADTTAATAAGEVGVPHAAVHDGVRQNTAAAYLRDAAVGRRNLHVTTDARVTRVMFVGLRAAAVELVRGRVYQLVHARREVILAAGTIGSPTILLHSGIGPRSHLQALGITPVADLPVGENLQDPIGVHQPEFRITEDVSLSDDVITSWYSQLQYRLQRSGPLASPCGTEAVAYIRDEHQPIPSLQISLQSFLIGNSNNSYAVFQRLLNIDRETFKFMYGDNRGKHGFMLSPTLLTPKSRGTVRLRSPNALSYPDVDPRYLSHADDVRALIRGIRVAQEFGATTAFREIGAQERMRVHPSCKEHTYDSDSYWECYIRHMASPTSQGVGTCRMGAFDDPLAVVDPQLRVRGVEGLRVVDASVMPVPPSGGILAASVMLAERGAELIKRDSWRMA